MIRFASFFLILPLLLLSGCVNLIPTPADPPQRVEIELQPPPQDLASVKWQLAIEEPTTYANLNSTRISTRQFSKSGFPIFSYVRNKEWIERLPVMLQTQMVRYMQQSKAFTGVGRTSDGLKPDYTLITDIHDFQIEYPKDDGAPNIHVSLSAQILSVPGRKVVTINQFDRQISATDSSFVAILQAFENALNEVLNELTKWLAEYQQP